MKAHPGRVAWNVTSPPGRSPLRGGEHRRRTPTGDFTMRTRSQALLIAGALLLAGWAVPTSAQQPTPGAAPAGPQVLDRVAAVVGDSIILLSEVDEQVFRATQGELPDDPAAQEQLRRNMLEQLIDQELLLQEAAQDTLVDVSEDRVQQVVDQELTLQIQQFGGEEQLRQELETMGQTLSGYRDSMADEVRTHLMLEQYMQIQLQQGGDSEIDERELREFFEENQEEFGVRPATLGLHQVVLQLRASDEAQEAAVQRAEELREMILDGESFEEVARRESDDSESREQGGELGWYRQGDPELLEEIEDMAFSLGVGQLSPVVVSALGAHLVRVDRRRGGERLIRHILVATDVTEEDRERTLERAEEIRERIEAGENAEDLAAEFSTVDLPTRQEIRVDQIPQLPQGFAGEILDPETGELQAEAGEVLGPITFEYQGQETYAVVHVDEIREEGDWTFEEVRGELAEHMGMEQLQQQLLDGLREKHHVENRLAGGEDS